MTEIVGLRQIALVAGGGQLTASIRAGEVVAVVGAGASGKTQFLRVVAGEERPTSGVVERHGACQYIEAGSLSRRTKISALLRGQKRGEDATHRAEILMAARLWDWRDRSVSDLSPSQIAAAELLPAMANETPVVAIDGQFDLLDPWTLRSVRAYMAGVGKTLIVATHRPDLAAGAELIVALRDRHIRFAGPVADILRHGLEHEIRVRTEKDATLRSLVAPFAVSVTDDGEGGYILRAREGQELAARLLLEGYGDIETVYHRPPRLEDALVNLIGSI